MITEAPGLFAGIAATRFKHGMPPMLGIDGADRWFADDHAGRAIELRFR